MFRILLNSGWRYVSFRLYQSAFQNYGTDQLERARILQRIAFHSDAIGQFSLLESPHTVGEAAYLGRVGRGAPAERPPAWPLS